jgi:hypothetical protein
MALRIPVRLQATTPASLNGCGGPWWKVLMRALNLMEDILSTFFLIRIVRGGVHLGPLSTAATNRPIVPAPGNYDDGEIGGMIGRANRSTRRKPAPVPLCPPQNPHAARMRTRAATMGGQRLTAWAKARPLLSTYYKRNLSAVTHKLNVFGHMLIWTLFFVLVCA